MWHCIHGANQLKKSRFSAMIGSGVFFRTDVSLSDFDLEYAVVDNVECLRAFAGGRLFIHDCCSFLLHAACCKHTDAVC